MENKRRRIKILDNRIKRAYNVGNRIFFGAECNSPPAVKSAKSACSRTGEIPVPTVIVRMEKEKGNGVFYALRNFFGALFNCPPKNTLKIFFTRYLYGKKELL